MLFRSPSLFRLLSSLPSVALVAVSDVEWPDVSDGFQPLQAPLRCPMSIPNAKTLICSDCTDGRLAAWLFAWTCTRWQPPVRDRRVDQLEVPPAALTIMALVEKIFDKDDDLVATKVRDTISESPNAGC